ncbi:MAG: metallophosphoesterase [Geobacteraceae bacterium]|nr:metallophosphoesterase [Geobacteraceae bacterium]
MKLLILSDSHGNYPLALSAVEKAGRVDQIIHLGDEIEDARIIELITGRRLIKVPGNCDPDAGEPRELSVTFGGRNLFLTHGDLYQVKSGLASLRKKAAETGAAIVLYGHTHLAAIEEIDGVLFINPGCLGARCRSASYALLTIAAGRVTAEIFPVNLL